METHRPDLDGTFCTDDVTSTPGLAFTADPFPENLERLSRGEQTADTRLHVPLYWLELESIDRPSLPDEELRWPLRKENLCTRDGDDESDPEVGLVFGFCSGVYTSPDFDSVFGEKSQDECAWL